MRWGPEVCGNGHPMRYPNVVVNWTACECSKAGPRPQGHLFQQCRTCLWEWREGGCDELVDGYPVRHGAAPQDQDG